MKVNILRVPQIIGLMLFGLLLSHSCKDPVEPEKPIASFQVEVSETDFLSVICSNFSQNATTYEWDFGDGVGTSTEESPTYTYATTGTYSISLTASNDEGEQATQIKDIEIKDPDEALALLAGTTSKTWKLLREGPAIGIGPSFAEFTSWWFNSNDGTRNCLYDDEFIFGRDGSFTYTDGGTFWGEGNIYTTGSDKEHLFETCFDATVENLTIDGVDKSAWLGKPGDMYTYTYDPSTSSMTLTGEGAWIGLVKLGTSGDVTEPQASVSFSVDLADGGATGVDTMDVLFNHDPNYWRARYVSYDDPNDEPPLTVAVPEPIFSYTVNGLEVTFTNSSKNADSYMWDFGDGGTSSEENPVHTYAGAGCYEVVLTASGQGLSEMKTETVLVTAPATFEPAVLSNATGKIWRLAGEGSYKVGPSPGAGDWWGGIDAAGVIERACQLDDEFIFTDGGVFEIDDKGEVWAEGYMMGANACVDPATLPAPFSGLSSGTHTFSADATTITVTGDGAYLGWSLPYNGGEIVDSDTALPTEITYTVLEYIASPCKEVLVIYIESNAGVFWTMTLESTI